MKRIFSAILVIVTLLVMILSVSVTASADGVPGESLPELIITELSVTANTTNATNAANDKYSFIEICNSSAKNLNLADYGIFYFSNAYAGSGTKSTGCAGIADTSTTIIPGGVKVIFLQRNAADAAADFITYFNTNFKCALIADDVITVSAASIPGVTNAAPFIYGIINKTLYGTDSIYIGEPDGGVSHGDKTSSPWVSWATYCSYAVLGAEIGLINPGDAASWTSIASCRASNLNLFYSQNTNMCAGKSVNYIYGLDASEDCRQGIQFTYPCAEMSPGTLMSWQKAQFDSKNTASPDLAITSIMADSEDTAGVDGYEYMTVQNVSGGNVNIFDYTVLGRSSISGNSDAGTEYSMSYFNCWDYLIPGDTGNIWAYDKSCANYKESIISNVKFKDGALDSGETAVIWFYTSGNLAAGTTLAAFRAKYSLADAVKIFVVDAVSTAGTSSCSQRTGLDNSGACVYGLAKKTSLKWESTYTDAYPEIVPQTITYESGYNYQMSGVPVSAADCFVFLYYQFITGSAGTLNYDPATSVTTVNAASLGEGKSVYYVWRDAAGSTNRIGSYLDLAKIKSGLTNVPRYESVAATSTKNYWYPTAQEIPDFANWTVNISSGKLYTGQARGLLANAKEVGGTPASTTAEIPTTSAPITTTAPVTTKSPVTTEAPSATSAPAATSAPDTTSASKEKSGCGSLAAVVPVLMFVTVPTALITRKRKNKEN